MRTCLSHMRESRIDPETLKLARQLSKMFPECEQVYALFEKGSFYLMSSSDITSMLGKLSGDSDARRYFCSKTYALREKDLMMMDPILTATPKFSRTKKAA